MNHWKSEFDSEQWQKIFHFSTAFRPTLKKNPPSFAIARGGGLRGSVLENHMDIQIIVNKTCRKKEKEKYNNTD
jgi:hypothetical protein